MKPIKNLLVSSDLFNYIVIILLTINIIVIFIKYIKIIQNYLKLLIHEKFELIYFFFIKWKSKKFLKIQAK